MPDTSGRVSEDREQRGCMQRRRRVILLAISALGVPWVTHARPASAQRLTGVVLDEAREVPLPSVAVTLLDKGGTRRAGVLTDSMGSFVLEAPEPGEYSIEAARYGYETTRSPLLAVGSGQSAPLEILLRPSPIGLAGLEVSVEREAAELLRNLGQSQATLGRRFISRTDIEQMPLPIGPLEVVRWRAIPGVFVRESFTPGTASLCVVFMRRLGCAAVYLNGVQTRPDVAQAINPGDLEAIAILTPVEATTFFGTEAGNGAVLLWTRRGGR